MKKYFLPFILLLLFAINGKSQTIQELQETARSFMTQGDYTNAIIVLNRAVQMDAKNLDIIKDLAMNYYLQKDYNKGLEVIKPALDREDADDQCFQIAGNFYKQLDDAKECEKLFRRGIKKFPESGAMYNELGELLLAKQDPSAIKQWEKGIESDPNYSRNYYNAAKFYSMSPDKSWSILYGEIFINMEPLSNKTPEIKTILLECYKKLFTESDLLKESKEKNEFMLAFLQTMNKQSSVAASGINAESLSMIRARFILDWSRDFSAKFPYRLFDYQQQLLQEGMFDAYNQWIFGSAQNLAAYQLWTTTHASEYAEFSRFQKGRSFKFPQPQYYR